MKNQALKYNANEYEVDAITSRLSELGYRVSGSEVGNPYIVAFPDEKIAGFVNEKDIFEMRPCIHHFAVNFFHALSETEQVDHPAHYGGADNPYEAVKVIAAHNLDFFLGSVIQYVLRSDKKGNTLQDLKKAAWYLNKKIELLSAK